MTVQGGHEQTLCWLCQRSYKPGVMCSWARRFVPVVGWEAVYNPIKEYHGAKQFRYKDSYIVERCPQFLPDRI